MRLTKAMLTTKAKRIPRPTASSKPPPLLNVKNNNGSDSKVVQKAQRILKPAIEPEDQDKKSVSSLLARPAQRVLKPIIISEAPEAAHSRVDGELSHNDEDEAVGMKESTFKSTGPFHFDAPMWKDFSSGKYQRRRRLLEHIIVSDVSPGGVLDEPQQAMSSDSSIDHGREREDELVRVKKSVADGPSNCWFARVHCEHEPEVLPTPPGPLISPVSYHSPSQSSRSLSHTGTTRQSRSPAQRVLNDGSSVTKRRPAYHTPTVNSPLSRRPVKATSSASNCVPNNCNPQGNCTRRNSRSSTDSWTVHGTSSPVPPDSTALHLPESVLNRTAAEGNDVLRSRLGIKSKAARVVVPASSTLTPVAGEGPSPDSLSPAIKRVRSEAPKFTTHPSVPYIDAHFAHAIIAPQQSKQPHGRVGVDDLRKLLTKHNERLKRR